MFQQRIAELGDEIAKKTSWIPLSSGGANFSTHCLKEDKEGNYYVTSTWQSFVLSWVFFLVSIVSLLTIYNSQNSTSSQDSMWVLVPIIFIGVGIFLIIQCFKKKIFDFPVQSFYSYFFRKKTDWFEGGIPLGNIHALQIISSLHSSSRSTEIWGRRYYNYEINIVLKNADRKHICIFSDINMCQESAWKIAQRLNVPVWDISDILTYPSIITTGNPWN